jgi:predicted Zn-dependent protease with MMP-like domain
MTPTEFEQLVNEGIAAIPKKFRDLLDNVAITIDDVPTPEQLAKSHLQPGWMLFGLYEGVPQTKRGNPYVVTMPDKITIFRLPIMAQAADDPEAIKEIVKNTVWHEVAHYFGMDEQRVRKAERKKSRSGIL